MDRLPNLSPHLVTHPVALAALGAIAVLILAIVGAPWYAYGLVVLMLVAVFAAVIRFPQLRMEGDHLYSFTSGEEFSGFSRDASQSETANDEVHEGDLDALRIAAYETTRGLFLVHSWRRSEDRTQVADIIIRLQEHRDISTRPSLLAEGKIESVRYELGRRFFKEPPIKRNPENGFALEVSAYRPMLCFAEVCFNDGHSPVHLSRYIDFPTGS